MGVQGLWQLLDPLGRPVTLESLENKVLAVDASLWIHQWVHGFRDRQSAAGGGPVKNAHLLGAFHRLCKLLFYRIKPVFVFDGSVPLLKRETIAARRERRADAARDAEKCRKEILSKHLKLRAVQAVMSEQTSSSPAAVASTSGVAAKSNHVDPDLYELPPMPNLNGNDEEDIDDPAEIEFHEGQFGSSHQNLEEVDFNSDEFDALPLEIQHEILVELKETLKRKSWTMLSIMPDDPEEVGKLQIKQLLNRRRVQQKLEKVSKELSKTALDIAGSELFPHLDDCNSPDSKAEVRRIVSEDSAHYILLKNIAKKPVVIFRPSSSSCASSSSLAPVVVASASSMHVRQKSSHPETTIVVAPSTETNSQRVPITAPSSESDPDDFEALNNNAEPDQIKLGLTSELVIREPDLVDLDHISSEPERIKIRTTSELSNEPHVTNTSDVVTENATQVADHASKQDLLDKNKVHKAGVLRMNEQSAVTSDSQFAEMRPQIKLDLSQSQKKIVEDFVLATTESNLVRSTPSEQCETITPRVPAMSTMPIDVESEDDDDDDDFVEVKSVPDNDDDSTSISDQLFPLELFQKSSNAEPSTCNSSAADRADDDVTKDDVQRSSDDDVIVTYQMMSAVDSPNLTRLDLNLDGQDLEVVSEQLRDEMADLAQVQDRQERVAASITDEMYVEIQELLRLFGVPYLVSPAEAEAQCAVLDVLELTEGTITDDSDVWLFGAKRVYKNFFNQDRDLLFFRDCDVRQRLGLDRRKLIAIALLTGSDYTDGVKGVGVVSSLELLAEFGSKSKKEDEDDGIECLRRFRTWWDKTRTQEKAPSSETKVKKSLRGLALHDGFPSAVVVDAYMEPTVDASTTPFSWARPDLDELRHFACIKLGWSKEKVDGVLLPVIKQLNAKNHQTHLTAYFESVPSTVSHSGQSNRGRQHSQRVRRAIKRVRRNKEGDDDDDGTDNSFERTLSSSRSISKKFTADDQTVRRKNPRRNATFKSSSTK